jgi:HK97 family phage major capsid protein
MDFRDSPHYRADAPGARLDDQPWARSWPAFLSAVFDSRDGSARQFIRNAWTERIPSEGGFLVPESLRASVMAYVTPAVVRPRALVLPMGTLRMGIPVLDSSSQAGGAQSLGGMTFSFVQDGAAIPSSTPGLARVMLEAQKLAALAAIPNELDSDAAGALGDLFSRVVALGYSWYEDDAFIGGNGAGQPQGVLNAPCAVTVTRAASGLPAAADLANMISAFHPASLAAGYAPEVNGVGWLVSQSVITGILQQYLVPGGGTATSGAPASLPAWLSLGDGRLTAPAILGLPALISDHSPAAGSAGDIALVDFRHYAIGDRMELTVDRSAAGSGFASDVTNYRFRARVDGRYTVMGPITPEIGAGDDNADLVSPVVILGAAS